MTDTFYALLAISMVLVVVSLLVPVAERFRLPHTVLLAIAGMGMGFLGSWMITSGVKLGALGDAFVGLDKLEVGADMFLPLFLPPLLFTAGLNIEVRRLMDEVHAVLLLAIVAVVVCIASVGFVVHWATGMDLVVCLLLGAVVSTTDPAAVIGIFRDVGAPKRLSILAEGKSLLNDAVAIAAFGLFIGILVSRVDPSAAMPGSAGGVVVVFLREFVGGLVLGFLLARAAMFMLPRLGESEAAIASITVALSYLSFVVADRYLHVSGVVSTVMAALTVAAYGPTHLHPHQWTSLKRLWEQLEFWASCLIFVLASMLAANVLLQVNWLYFLARRRGGGRRLRGARAGRVRHAAGAGEGPSRPAGRQPIQGHPGVGRPARRRHDRAGHGGGRQRQAARGHPRVHCAVGHAVRAVHAVRQRNDARPVHACCSASTSCRAWSLPCATACWPCRRSTSTAICSRSSAGAPRASRASPPTRPRPAKPRSRRCRPTWRSTSTSASRSDW